MIEVKNLVKDYLNQTPAVFVGNRKLPEIYTNEDLVYFLEYGVIGDL